MNADDFWNVIAQYNQNTKWIQTGLFIFLIIAMILGRNKKTNYLTKLSFGIVNLYIAVCFFGFYGTQPIQKFFAFPLFLVIGFLFIYESFKNKDDVLQKPNIVQIILLSLCFAYPFVSILVGGRFPKMVTHIMPCPVATVSLVIYSLYKKKNRLLLLLLTVWGLTGVKSIIFNAYEDLILLLCGLYGVWILAKKRFYP